MSRFVNIMVWGWGVTSLVLALGAASVNASNADLTYWLPQEVNSSHITEPFQSVVSASPVAFTGPSKQIHIAIVYPSADLSDFWVRNYDALTGRLDDLNIAYAIDEYSSKQIEHALQTHHTDQVLAKQEHYDFVIFGPSELYVQADNIQRLSHSEDFKTFIWAFHTPIKRWSSQPDAWFDFSSAEGAVALCEFVVDKLGNNVAYAMNRGIPGITDDQRSGDFKACVAEKGQWMDFYEHFGQYQSVGGEDGARLVTQNFPEVQMLHNANTAMTLGALSYLKSHDLGEALYVTGWGGTGAEIELIRTGELSATPMRMGDDVGVATAEAIKYHLEGRPEEVPQIYLGRIEIVDKSMSPEQIDALTKEAFRYSGS